MIKTLAHVGWFTALAACGAAQACQLRAVTVLPIRDEGSPMVFDATINGKPARLRLDTGSDRTTLDLAAADRLGVDMHLTDYRTYGQGGSQGTSFGHAGKMQIGTLAANNFLVRGLNLQQGGRKSETDGYVGMDILSSYDLDIDMVGGHVIVFDATGVCLKPMVAMAQPLMAMPLVLIDRDMQADVEVVVDGQPLRALLDTSVRHSFIYRSAASRMGLDLAGLSAPGHAVSYGMGPFPVAVMPHVFNTVQIGPITFNKMSLNVVAQPNTGLDRQRTGSLFAADSLPGGHEMVLGADFMRKVHVWISNSSHQLVMQYPPQASVLPH